MTQFGLRTPVAVIGTLAEFHPEPIPYNLGALIQLVSKMGPDFLCLDLTEDQWRHRDFGDLPREYREALLPLAHQTDIVVVPIAGEHAPQEPSAPGWRGSVIAVLRRWLRDLQRTAPGPTAFVGGLRHHIADGLYELMGWISGWSTYRAWRTYTDELGRGVLDVARRDPGRRVLVAVNLRHCHHIRNALKRHPEIQVIPYWQL